MPTQVVVVISPYDPDDLSIYTSRQAVIDHYTRILPGNTVTITVDGDILFNDEPGNLWVGTRELHGETNDPNGVLLERLHNWQKSLRNHPLQHFVLIADDLDAVIRGDR